MMMTQLLPVPPTPQTSSLRDLSRSTNLYDIFPAPPRKSFAKTCPPRRLMAQEKEATCLLQKLRKTEGNRLQVLSSEQVERLHEVMCQTIPVHSRNSDYPTIHICLKDFAKAVKQRLRDEDVEISDIRLNGTTASYIIGSDYVSSYNDIDFLFGVNFSSQQCSNINKVKSATLDALMSFLPPNDRAMESSNSTVFRESYISKLFRMVSDAPLADRWSLIGLGNTDMEPTSTTAAKSIEIKFVDRMKRSYEFTVDSFQIILDSLLTFYDVTTVPMSEHFYPTVVADSVAGSFQDALDHLKNRIIYTKNPEEIRGGGLLKYCRLLLEGYQSSPEIDIRQMEKYMCSRFFIDFPDIQSQKGRLVSYLNCHFSGQNEKKIVYLDILQNVIWTSTVCLMNHERYQTLRLIESLIGDIRSWETGRQQVHKHAQGGAMNQLPEFSCSYYESNIPAGSSVIKQEDIGGNDWVLDQVVYGTQCFPEMPVNSLGASSLSSSMYTSPGELSPSSSMGLADSHSTYSSLMDGVSYTSSVCPSPGALSCGAMSHMIYPQPWGYPLDYCSSSLSLLDSIPAYQTYFYPPACSYHGMPTNLVREGAGPPL